MSILISYARLDVLARRCRGCRAVTRDALTVAYPSQRIDARASLARLRHITAIAMAAVTIVAVFPASASALANGDPDYWKQTAERRDTVYRMIYSQSPQTIPSTYDPVREAEEILREQQRTLPSSNPTVRSLWQQIRTITVTRSLSTPLRALGTVGLGVGVFEFGWKIGSGINAKFLKIGIPEHTPWNPSTPQQLSFRTQGYYVYSGLLFPYDGWEWEWGGPGNWRAFWVTPVGNGTAQACPASSNPPALPAGFEDVVGDPHPNCGSANNGGGNGGVAHVAAVREDTLTAPAPVAPYTNQPFDRSSSAPAAPARTTVEAGVGQDLDKPANTTLRDWLNYKLGSPGQNDPTGTGEPNPRATVTIPDCSGLTYSTCGQVIRDTGFQGTISRQSKTFETADVTKPANAVLEIDPATGSSVDADGAIVITANPPDVDMPRLVPSPGGHETRSAYSDRLRELDLVPDEHVVTETPGESWAGDVLSTTPSAGARVRRDTTVTTQSAWRPAALYQQNEEHDSSCEPSAPRYEGPGLLGPFTPGLPPQFASIDGAVPLWKGELIDGLQGWGERHIAAKHGWETQDRTDTALALTSPIAVERDRPQPNAIEPYLYLAVTPTRNGKPCVRVVRVERGTWPAESSKRGVITSFGAVRTFP